MQHASLEAESLEKGPRGRKTSGEGRKDGRLISIVVGADSKLQKRRPSLERDMSVHWKVLGDKFNHKSFCLEIKILHCHTGTGMIVTGLTIFVQKWHIPGFRVK